MAAPLGAAGKYGRLLGGKYGRLLCIEMPEDLVEFASAVLDGDPAHALTEVRRRALYRSEVARHASIIEADLLCTRTEY